MLRLPPLFASLGLSEVASARAPYLDLASAPDFAHYEAVLESLPRLVARAHAPWPRRAATTATAG